MGLGLDQAAAGAVRPAAVAPALALAPAIAVANGAPQVVAAKFERPVLGSAVLAQPVDARDLDCLAQAVYSEARGEPEAGQAAVAQVVINRVGQPAFAPSVCGVVYQGAGTHDCQFSFACRGGAPQGHREPDAWAQSRAVAARALSGYVMSEIRGATYFHVASLGAVWGARMAPVARVGHHVFYSPGGRRDLGRAYRLLEADAKAPGAREALRGPEKPTPPVAPLQSASVQGSQSNSAGPRSAS